MCIAIFVTAEGSRPSCCWLYCGSELTMSKDILRIAAESIAGYVQTSLAEAWPDLRIQTDSLSAPEPGAPTLALYLYNIVVNENGAAARPRRVAKPAANYGEDGYVFLPPPIGLTAHFVATAYASALGAELELLGSALQLFQESPRVPAGEASADPFIISLDSGMSPERLAALFRSHGTPIRPAIGYRTKMEVRSEKVVREAAATRSVQSKVDRRGQSPAAHAKR